MVCAVSYSFVGVGRKGDCIGHLLLIIMCLLLLPWDLRHDGWLLIQAAETGNLEGFRLLVFQNFDKIAAFLLAVQLTPMSIISMAV